MKAAKIIAGLISGFGFLFLLGSIGNIDFTSANGVVMSPDEILGNFIRAGAGMLIFFGGMVFIAIAEYFEEWKRDADISAIRRYTRRSKG